MKDQLDENFIKSLVVIAQGIARGKSDPYELVNGAVEYLIKNKEKYMDHPNLKALAVMKMKGIFIDEIRKSKSFTSMTDEEGKEIEVVDEKQSDILDKISLTFECKKVLSVIKSMNEKCSEILMLAAENLNYKEIAKTIDIPIGTVESRLFNCRKELKGLMAQ